MSIVRLNEMKEENHSTQSITEPKDKKNHPHQSLPAPNDNNNHPNQSIPAPNENKNHPNQSIPGPNDNKNHKSTHNTSYDLIAIHCFLIISPRMSSQ